MKNGREKWAFILSLIEKQKGDACSIADMYARIKPGFTEYILRGNKAVKVKVNIPFSVYRAAIRYFMVNKKLYFEKSKNHNSNCNQPIFLINKIKAA